MQQVDTSSGASAGHSYASAFILLTTNQNKASNKVKNKPILDVIDAETFEQ